MVIRVEQLTGGYGKRPVVKDVNFESDKGEIIGLIGLNGASKSATIKYMLELLTPMGGSLSISGISTSDDVRVYRRKLSYILGSPVIYEELALGEHTEMTVMVYDIDRDEAMNRAMPLSKTFRLENELKVFPSHFSKGMRQRIMIICASIVNPELYIIDESFLGLDPLRVQSMLDLMVEEKNEGRTALMNIHILATAERCCNRFIILDESEVVAPRDSKASRQQAGLHNRTSGDIYIHVMQGGDVHA